MWTFISQNKNSLICSCNHKITNDFTKRLLETIVIIFCKFDGYQFKLKITKKDVMWDIISSIASYYSCIHLSPELTLNALRMSLFGHDNERNCAASTSHIHFFNALHQYSRLKRSKIRIAHLSYQSDMITYTTDSNLCLFTKEKKNCLRIMNSNL